MYSISTKMDTLGLKILLAAAVLLIQVSCEVTENQAKDAVKLFLNAGKDEPNPREKFLDAVTRMENELKVGLDKPCDEFKPASPDFESKHQISEARCLDYIWSLKKREELNRRSHQCKDLPSTSNFIVGGRSAKQGSYPHMGAVGWPAKKGGWLFLCGSSIISHMYLLTAAHCHSAEGINDDVATRRPKIVRIGVVDIVHNERPPVDMEIHCFINHPNYRFPKKYYDIAVIRLKKPIRFNDFIRPACMWNKYDLRGAKTAFVTGWGVNDRNVGSTRTSAKLQVADIDIIPSHECNTSLALKQVPGQWWGVKNHQMCATKVNGSADACRGDSGGPLQIKVPSRTEKSLYSILGVTSLGFVCASSRFPSIYTRVSVFVPWVESVIWGDNKNGTDPVLSSRSYRRFHNSTVSKRWTKSYTYRSSGNGRTFISTSMHESTETTGKRYRRHRHSTYS